MKFRLSYIVKLGLIGVYEYSNVLLFLLKVLIVDTY